MSTPKNRNTLYRFVSLRSPELSKKENQEKRFVFHPDNKTGKFFDAVKNKPTNQTNWETMQKAAIAFGHETESELENLDKSFFAVSEWVARNKSHFDIKELLKKIKTLNPLDLEIELNLWDNLFYQVLTQKSFYVKEAIIQMLVLNNLLKQTKGLIDKEILDMLPTLAQARVVLPSTLFEEKKQTLPTSAAKITTQEVVLNKSLLDAQKIEASKTTIQVNQMLISELQQLETKYFSGYADAYAKAQKEYQTKVKPALDKYQKEFTEAQRKLCEVPRPDNYDPNDICSLPNVVYPELPEFSFTPTNEFDLKILEGQLSSSSYELLSKIPNVSEVRTFREAVSLIESDIKAENKTVLDKTLTSESIMIVGDASFPITNNIIDNSLTFQLCSSRSIQGFVSMYMSIQLPNSTYGVSSFIYHLKYSDGSHNTNGYFESAMNGNVITLTKMFNNSLTLLDAPNVAGIAGEITFTNGRTMGFDITPLKLLNCYSGILKDVVVDPGEDNTPDSSFIPNKFGYRQLGIADYKKVVSEICCYDAGEVAHIENIMAREFKEKTTEKNIITETTTFQSEEIEKESLSDTTSTERFEMQTEIAKMLQEQRQITGYVDTHVTGTGYTLDAGGTYASNTTKEQSNLQAVNQAKEVTQRALERIISRVKNEKTVKVTESFKDLNSHIFDNRNSGEHVSGVYRFINAIYKNQIYNYGKRLMYEFMVPQPSKLHLLGLQLSQAKKNAFLLEKPIDPRTIGYTDFTKITETNYQALAAKYGVDVDTFPDRTIYIGKSFDYFTQSSNTANSKNDSIAINDDRYVSKFVNVKINGTAPGNNTGWGKGANLTVGDIVFGYSPINGGVFWPTGTIAMQKYKKSIPIAFWSTNLYTLNITVTLTCELTIEATSDWQKQTFNTIIDAYNEQLRIYNEKLSEAKTNGVQILDSNPLFYRQIEQTVLRKNCISYLLDNSPNSTKTFGLQMYSGTSFDTHQVTQTQEMDNYASFAKFMEQAFEWNLMSYNFYPFYWGYNKEWSDLYQFETNDAIFRNFMQAGMARVVVTVKPGFEDAVMHYMALGQIWNGGQMPVLGDPLYLSIVDELKEQEYVIEETWETVLPTNLVALQSSGVALLAEGLPCGDDCLEAKEDNPFSKNGNTLGNIIAPA